MDDRVDSSRASRVNPKFAAKGRGGKGSSKGTAGKSKGNAESTSSSHGGDTKGTSKGGKGSSKGKAGKSKGNAETASALHGGKGTGHSKGMRSHSGKGKHGTCSSRLPLTAQGCYSEPKCVRVLQQRYGCQVGDVFDIEGDSKYGRNWLEAGSGGRTLPKFHEGVGWEKLHGDVERPNRIRIIHGFYGCGQDAVLRVEGETEDHRRWLTECGNDIPTNQVDVFWEALDSSSEDNRRSDDDSSSGHDYKGHESLDADADHCVASSDGMSDLFRDQERFPEYLRDERPDLDYDGLDDLYQGMPQADAEEFGGDQCDSD